MNPYASQWAQYGYTIGSPADPSTAAAYPAYYNYAGVQAATPPVAPTNNHVTPVPATGPKNNRQPRYEFCSFVFSRLAYNASSLLLFLRPQQQPQMASNSWQSSAVLPTSTYVPTKAFVKAGAENGDNAVYDPSNSAMKLHQLAIHNHVTEIYEKVLNVLTPFIPDR